MTTTPNIFTHGNARWGLSVHSPGPGSADHSPNDREDALGRNCPQTGHPAKREEQVGKPGFERFNCQSVRDLSPDRHSAAPSPLITFTTRSDASYRALRQHPFLIIELGDAFHSASVIKTWPNISTYPNSTIGRLNGFGQTSLPEMRENLEAFGCGTRTRIRTW